MTNMVKLPFVPGPNALIHREGVGRGLVAVYALSFDSYLCVVCVACLLPPCTVILFLTTHLNPKHVPLLHFLFGLSRVCASLLTLSPCSCDRDSPAIYIYKTFDASGANEPVHVLRDLHSAPVTCIAVRLFFLFVKP